MDRTNLSTPDAASMGRPRAARTLIPPSTILRLEGVALLVAGLAAHAQLDVGWGTFAVLLLLPDVGLLGYLAGGRVGAATYNLTHTTTLPLLLGAVSLALGAVTPGAVASTWLAHIGIDRVFGFGLKYPTSVRDTHLQRVG